eukprot:913443-Prymnesium_polylepis.1
MLGIGCSPPAAAMARAAKSMLVEMTTWADSTADRSARLNTDKLDANICNYQQRRPTLSIITRCATPNRTVHPLVVRHPDALFGGLAAYGTRPLALFAELLKVAVRVKVVDMRGVAVAQGGGVA